MKGVVLAPFDQSQLLEQSCYFDKVQPSQSFFWGRKLYKLTDLSV